MLLPLLLLSLAFQGQPTFRSEVSLVRVDAEVHDQDRLIDGLVKGDSRITDGGKPVDILYFAHEAEPLDVILLFDTSLSMRLVVARVAETAQAALGNLRPGDRAAVMAFDADTDLILDFTDDLAAVERAIREQVLHRQFIPNSQIQRGLNDAALHFIKGPSASRRRAVLVVTDNVGSGTEPQALSNLWEADAVAAGLVVPSRISKSVGFRMVRLLLGEKDGIKEIVERTGGDMLNPDDVGTGLAGMIQRLRLRYSLNYAMPEAKPGEERKIRVELGKEAARRYPSAKIRARSGYIVPVPATNPR